MKKNILPLLILLFLFACSKDDENNTTYKGLVYFTEDPVYLNGYITFTAIVQFGFKGKAVPIEYQVLEGNTLITGGDAATVNGDAGLGAFFETDPISIPIDLDTYSGKTITVWLDPDNKITDDEYTNDDMVELFKKEEVTIP
jgi:hypothetical protein